MALAPLESLYEDGRRGEALPLPPTLEALYGPLRFPARTSGPYVFGNFVATLDGVTSLSVPGRSGGGEISGFNVHDRLVMGLLRAVADAVVVGAGTFRSVPNHLWTAEYVYPALADDYRRLRRALGKATPPLNVIVTARGELDLSRRVFQGEAPALIVTTPAGARQVRAQSAQSVPPSVQIVPVGMADTDRLSAGAVLEALRLMGPSEFILVEGGPQLMGDFFAERHLHELFLTLAPQVAGRDGSAERPGLVAGRRFAPEHPVWGRLVGLKRGGDHLFLRYAFESGNLIFTRT